MPLKFKLFVGLAIALLILSILISPYIKFVDKTLQVSVLKTLFSKDTIKVFDEQVNILLLGISGGDHDGPNLSDSNIVINYNFKTNTLSTISIPRDLWSKTLQDKINSAYAYGEAKKPGRGGFALAKAEISEVVGFPIQYAAVIDFQQFKELIDYIGEINVVVDTSFIDKKFPIAGKENDDCDGDKEYRCRYETISFTKGTTSMDGDTALKYARSRNAEGSEGTDFSREKRQQKVIEAIKNKMVALVKKPNLKTYESLYRIINNLIKRDISNQQMAIIVKNIFFLGNFKQKKIILDQEFFYNPPLGDDRYKGLWVLLPDDNSYDFIHQFIACNLKGDSDCMKLKDKSKEDK